MRSLLTLGYALVVSALLLAPSAPADAAVKKAAAASLNKPELIGQFRDWEAATHSEAGQTICYAFTRAESSEPAAPGRGGVVLTVTQRPNLRDSVAISAGFAYPPKADVEVSVDKTDLSFYTAGRSAFARDGQAAVKAFRKGRLATAVSPDPKGGRVTDTFSLLGFTNAYEAASKACPAK